MTPEEMMGWAKAAAVVAGLVLGVFCISAASWVWFKKQRFGYGATLLCGVGTVLIVASIFHNVTLVVGPANGFELRLSEIEKELEANKKILASVRPDEITAKLKQAENQLTKVQAQFQLLSRRVSETEKLSNEVYRAISEQKGQNGQSPDLKQAPFSKPEAPVQQNNNPFGPAR